MAKRSEYFFQSHDDPKTQIHAVRWLPEDDEYVGVLQICHGMQEYILRYDEFATYMADRGFVVVGHDHIGHGLSVRNQDELGIMHTDRPAEVMVEDILTNYERYQYYISSRAFEFYFSDELQLDIDWFNSRKCWQVTLYYLDEDGEVDSEDGDINEMNLSTKELKDLISDGIKGRLGNWSRNFL